MEGLRVVADDMEIVAEFAGELSDGDAPFLAVWFIGLEIFATERPRIGIVALDNRVEHSDIITAVVGLFDAEVVNSLIYISIEI